MTAETHEAIMNFLEQRGYKVAPVTVDYATTFAGPYRTQLRAGAADVAARIKEAFSPRSTLASTTRRRRQLSSRRRSGADPADSLQRAEFSQPRESIARVTRPRLSLHHARRSEKDAAYSAGYIRRTRRLVVVAHGDVAWKEISVANARVPDWIRAWPAAARSLPPNGCRMANMDDSNLIVVTDAPIVMTRGRTAGDRPFVYVGVARQGWNHSATDGDYRRRGGRQLAKHSVESVRF